MPIKLLLVVCVLYDSSAEIIRSKTVLKRKLHKNTEESNISLLISFLKKVPNAVLKIRIMIITITAENIVSTISTEEIK